VKKILRFQSLILGILVFSGMGSYAAVPLPPPLSEPEQPKAVALPTETVQPSPASNLLGEPPPVEPFKPIEPRMKKLPAGTFTMGCKNGRDNVEGVDKCEGDETPAHRVSVDSFWLGITEVTFDEWEICVKDGACPEAKDEGWGRGNRPVINVSWEDTQTYIGWLNKRTGKRYRLPTEAEWEYAARGGREDGAYPWGFKASHEHANYGGIEGKDQWEYTAPVGQFPANGFGLYDMQGNAWEWCEDWYAEDYYATSPAINPSGASSGSYRVLRGGSWLYAPLSMRSAFRVYFTPMFRYQDFGFRLAHGQ
jgi:formylglycine-generating enzyme required for sulfatase activity